MARKSKLKLSSTDDADASKDNRSPRCLKKKKDEKVRCFEVDVFPLLHDRVLGFILGSFKISVRGHFDILASPHYLKKIGSIVNYCTGIYRVCVKREFQL